MPGFQFAPGGSLKEVRLRVPEEKRLPLACGQGPVPFRRDQAATILLAGRARSLDLASRRPPMGPMSEGWHAYRGEKHAGRSKPVLSPRQDSGPGAISEIIPLW